MHPKAGILVLNGAQPMFHTASGSEALRIRWGREAREYQLSFSTQIVWELSVGSAPDAYTSITWEEIPDEIMDRLSVELIERFLKTQP